MSNSSATEMNDGQVQGNEDEISLLDLLQTVADNLRLLVLGPLLAGLLALGVSFALAPTFTATTKFLPPQQQQGVAAAMLQGLGALGGLAGAAAGIKSPNDQYLAILKSRSLQDALIERFDLMKRYEAKLKDDARLALGTKARASAGKDNLIEVQVDDSDPAFAAQLANAHVEELQKLLGRLALTEAQQRRLFFEKQLEQTKDKLTRAEQTLNATGLSSSLIKSAPAAAIGAVAQLEAQIAAQQIKLASMRGYLTESAPDFKQAQTELAAMRAQLTRLEQNSTGTSAGVGVDYITRYRDFKYYETLFELFSKQYELAKVDEAREGSVIQVLDVALPPERKSKPKKALIAVIATLATAMLLLLFVFVRQALRSVSREPESAQKLAQLKASVQRALGRR